jgi:hypothetical protein
LKKAAIILILFLGLGISNTYHCQEGGKKREKYQRKGKKRGNFHLTQYKSRGHADEFARSSGRQGMFSRLFNRDSQGWVYRSTTRRSNFKANRFLFTRDRSKGRMENEQTTTRQNNERAKKRDHGNRSFRFKKYKTK